MRIEKQYRPGKTGVIVIFDIILGESEQLDKKT